ncbi:MAG: hypothetical protein OEV12_09105 [Gammaproteobacteria bacterium]|nr:hypothetical protein [Gammaproteobacteria bacterium]
MMDPQTFIAVFLRQYDMLFDMFWLLAVFRNNNLHMAECSIAAPTISIGHTLLINALQTASYMLRSIGDGDAQYKVVSLIFSRLLYQRLLLAEQGLIDFQCSVKSVPAPEFLLQQGVYGVINSYQCRQVIIFNRE